MTGEPRQPSYVDLSDERDICFGGECGICGAGYATRAVPVQGVTGAPLRDLRESTLAQFEAAWRDLQVSCHSCGRGACPECWDVDNRMCAECADARGLVRAAYAPPTRGPLVDGRLVLKDRGTYSRIERPAWVGNLIASGRSNGAPGGEAYPEAPYVPVIGATLASEPTEQVPAAPNSQPLPPPVLPPDDGRYSMSPMAAPSGSSTANGGMVTCPRCGTANYDFATQCNSCQLQLVQICPNCEKLNPGQADRCDACGSLLARPRGWSGVLPAVPHDVITAIQREANAGVNTTPPASQGMRQEVGEPAGRAKTAVVPYVPNMPAMVNSRPTYMPGGMAPASPVALPPRERGQRRRPLLTADAGAMGIVSSRGQVGIGQPPLPVQAEGSIAKVGAVLDRVSGWLLVLVVVAVVGMLAAAELSPGADAALRGIIHIDIRQTLANFGHQIQLLWGRIHT